MKILERQDREMLEAVQDRIGDALNEDAMGGNEQKFDFYVRSALMLLEKMKKRKLSRDKRREEMPG